VALSPRRWSVADKEYYYAQSGEFSDVAGCLVVCGLIIIVGSIIAIIVNVVT
jgi:hypothetical protein